MKAGEATVLCPRCSGKTWKYGKIPSRLGMQQKYKCLGCAYTFVLDTLPYNAERVTDA